MNVSGVTLKGPELEAVQSELHALLENEEHEKAKKSESHEASCPMCGFIEEIENDPRARKMFKSLVRTVVISINPLRGILNALEYPDAQAVALILIVGLKIGRMQVLQELLAGTEKE